MSNDKLSKHSPVIPFVEIKIGQQEKYDWLETPYLTRRPESTTLNGPSYLKSFQMKRIVRGNSASTWTIQLFDPTSTLYEKILACWADDRMKGYGSGDTITFTFGYIQYDGTISQTEPIFAVMLKSKPTYRRQGADITFSGTTYGIAAAPTSPMYARVNPAFFSLEASDISPSTSVMSYLQTVLDASGLTTTITASNTGILNKTMENWSAFLGLGPESNMSLFNARMSSLGCTDLRSVSLRTFMRLIEVYLNDTSQGRFRLVVENNNVNETSLKIKIVDLVADRAEGIPIFIVNSTRNPDTGGDNVTNVISFSPNVTEVAGQIIGNTSTTYKGVDDFTRDEDTTTYEINRDFSGMVYKNLTKPPRADEELDISPNVDANLFDSGYVPSSGMAVPSSVSRLPTSDSSALAMIRKALVDVWGVMTQPATLSVAFPPVTIAPFSEIIVRVLTPDGEQMSTSGMYLITSVLYQIQAGQFTGTFALTRTQNTASPNGQKPVRELTQATVIAEPEEVE